MNYNFENNNSKKKEAEDKKNANYYKTERRLKDGGFVAWPENKLSMTHESADDKILEGRLGDGGYVAYPKSLNKFL